jgi:hypothetical protein
MRTLTPSHTISHCLLVFFLALDEREKEREIWGLESGTSPPPPPCHGGLGLVHFQGHAGALAQPSESRVHVGCRAHNLLHDRGPSVPRTGGGVSVLFCGIL